MDEQFIKEFNEYLADKIKQEIILPYLVKEGFRPEMIDMIDVTITNREPKKTTMKDIEALDDE